MAGAQKRE